MALDVVGEPVEMPAHPEEVVRLMALLGRPLVVLAQPVFQVALAEEALAADAVQTVVLLEVDVAGVVDLLEDSLQAVSGSPTIKKDGIPRKTSTSTSIIWLLYLYLTTRCIKPDCHLSYCFCIFGANRRSNKKPCNTMSSCGEQYGEALW